jgi:hypothetical protein
MAAGFETLIRSNQGIAEAVRSLQATMVAGMDMQSRFSADGKGGNGAAPPTPNHGGPGDPRAGQNSSGWSAGAAARAAVDYAAQAGRMSWESVRAGATASVMGSAYAARNGGGGSAPPPGPPAGYGTAGDASGGARGYGAGYGAPGGAGGGHGGGGGGGGHGGGSYAGGHAGGGNPGGFNLPGQNTGVGQWAGRNIPGVGLATDVFGEYMSQRRKNNYYVNINGGTQNQAMASRFEEFQTQFSNIGTLTPGESSEAFKAASRLGYQGAARRDAVGYIASGVQNRGQSVEEGTAQVDTAARSLTTSLAEMSRTMDQVTASASKAGINAQMMRAQADQLVRLGQSAGFGAGATGVAGAIVSANAVGGRAYASQTDATNVLSMSNQYRAASLTGQSLGSLQANIRKGNFAGGMGAIQKAEGAGLNAAVSTAEQQWIKDRIKSYGGGEQVKNSPVTQTNIAEEFLNTYTNKDPNAFTSIISGLAGRQFDGNNPVMAAQWVVLQLCDATDAAKFNEQQAASKPSAVGGASGNDLLKAAGGTPATPDGNGLAQSAVGFALGGIGGAALGGMIGRKGSPGSSSAAQKSYVAGAQASGKRDHVIEALLSNVKDQDKVSVRVKTGDGDRILSLADAISQYGDEVASGNVEFIGGGADGKTTADLSGGLVDKNRDYLAASSRKTTSGRAATDSDHAKSNQNQPMLGLTDEAKKLVQVMTGGPNASAVQQAAAGANPVIAGINLVRGVTGW